MRARRQASPESEPEHERLLRELKEARAKKDFDQEGDLLLAVRDLETRLRDEMDAARERRDFESEQRSYDDLLVLCLSSGSSAYTHDLAAIPLEWSEGQEWGQEWDDPGERQQDLPFLHLRRQYGRVHYARQLARKLASVEEAAVREALDLLEPADYPILEFLVPSNRGTRTVVGLDAEVISVISSSAEEEALRLLEQRDDEREAEPKERRARRLKPRERAERLLAAVSAIDTVEAVKGDLQDGRFIRALSFVLDEMERRPLEELLRERLRNKGGRPPKADRLKVLEKKVVALADDPSFAPGGARSQKRVARVRAAMKQFGLWTDQKRLSDPHDLASATNFTEKADLLGWRATAETLIRDHRKNKGREPHALE